MVNVAVTNITNLSHEYSSLNLMSRHFMLEKLDMRKFLGLISVVKLLKIP